MPTSWFFPSIVTEYAEVEEHVSWNNVGNNFTQINKISTTKNLLHIANLLVNDIKMKTRFLICTGFNWNNLPQNISGIEVYVGLRRQGRITDDTIQLYHNQSIGDNKATYDLAAVKTYGGENDLWGLGSIPASNLDVNFGIILRYQSHPSFPHSAAPIMDHVQLRVW
jgi:predicted extracellular nuclease